MCSYHRDDNVALPQLTSTVTATDDGNGVSGINDNDDEGSNAYKDDYRMK